MVQLQIPANVPSPRLCVIEKNAPNAEYGFNLHAERARGQFVGAVDEGSVAQRAGLRSGDRIFAVNGELISQLAHKEVVHRIKANSTRCELLVIDEAGARWYAEHSIPISPLLPNIIRTCSPHDYDDFDENEENINNLDYYPDSGFEQHKDSVGDARRVLSRATARLLVSDVGNEPKRQLVPTNSSLGLPRAECAAVSRATTPTASVRSLRAFMARLESDAPELYGESLRLPCVRSRCTFNFDDLRVVRQDRDDTSHYEQISDASLLVDDNHEVLAESIAENNNDSCNNSSVSRSSCVAGSTHNNNELNVCVDNKDSNNNKKSHKYHNDSKTNNNKENTTNLQQLQNNNNIENLRHNNNNNDGDSKPAPRTNRTVGSEAQNRFSCLKNDTSQRQVLQERKVEPSHEQLSFMVAKSANATGVASIASHYMPQPRLCRLIKSSPTDEFGFNLHAEHGKGHFIGAVDDDGIAHIAGLETGQRIVGVNGRLIFPNTPHHEVVAFIKQNPLSTELLVAPEAVDRWYADNGVGYSYERAIVYLPQLTKMPIASRQNGCGTTSPLDDAVRQHFYNLPGATNNNSSTTSTPSSCGYQRVNGSTVFLADRRSAEVTPYGYDSDRGRNGFTSENATYMKRGSTCSTPQQHVAATSPLSYNSISGSLRDDSTTKLSSLQTSALANGRRGNGTTVATAVARLDDTYSAFSGRDENEDIFKMSAREALRAVRIRAGAKKTNDPRLNSTLSLEDKHRLIANL